MARPPLPPLVQAVSSPSTPAERAQLARHITSWTLAGYSHTMRRPTTPWPRRATAGVLWLVGNTIRPILALIGRKVAHDPTRRFYATPSAILGVQARPDGWTITDHVTRTPGVGAGAHLRGLIRDDLLHAADHHHVALHLTTRHPELAALYRSEIPGLEHAGHSATGLIRLTRPPAQDITS